MKNALKVFVLLLALLMVLPAVVACGTEGGNENTTTQGTESETQGTQGSEGGSETESESTTEAETQDPTKVSQLDPDADWGNAEFVILGHADTNGHGLQFGNMELYAEEYDPTDVIAAAVYERNEAVANKYGIIVTANLVENAFSTSATHLEAQEDAYQLVIYRQSQIQAHASMGYFLNLNNTPNINLKHGCWTPEIIDQITFGTKLYYATSDLLIQDKNRIYIMYYHRELLRTRDLGYSYLEDQFLKTNTWTLENAMNIMKEFTYETDGQDGMTPADNFGLAAAGQECYGVFCFGAGVSISTKDADNYPVLTGATEAIVDRMAAAGNLFFDKKIDVLLPEDFKPLDYYGPITQLEIGKALFMAGIVSEFDSGFEPDFEYGYMPFPKFDSNQDRYYSTSNYEGASIFAIPYTADPEFAGFGLQALSEEATDTSLYAFLEERCMLEHAFDQRCADTLTLVFDSVLFDIAAMNNYGSIYKLIFSSIPALKNPALFSTLYGNYETLAKTAIEEIKTAYENFD